MIFGLIKNDHMMEKLDKTKSKSRTSIQDFLGFLKEVNQLAPENEAIIISGHACTYWIELYKKRVFPDVQWTATSGKDLDLLVSPKLMNGLFIKWDSYTPPILHIADMLFTLARRVFLRQPITPIAPQFIFRYGEIKTFTTNKKETVYVDFFMHPFGWHPDYVRKHAVKLEIEGVSMNMMSPVQCLWNFILASALLNQTRGDQGVKRNRKDHERTMRLIPVVREYLIDLKNGIYGEKSADLLQQSITDLKLMRKSTFTEIMEKKLRFQLENVIPDQSFSL
jgi:hypothetical protein